MQELSPSLYQPEFASWKEDSISITTSGQVGQQLNSKSKQNLRKASSRGNIHLPAPHDAADAIYRYGEDDGAVVLCWDAVQGLKVS